MKAVATIRGQAVAMPAANIDTDQILPKQFLRTISREGLGAALFHDQRFDESGAENADFLLNRPGCRAARILIAGENFACGSSREHAVWALLDFGIACVIAPSFAEIFAGNAINNGLLLVSLTKADTESLQAEASGQGEFQIDLPAQTILSPSGRQIHFDIEPGAKRRLVEGLDAIGETLVQEAAIEAFETSRAAAMPWLLAEAREKKDADVLSS
jgi:3-isopropylmalate/(R)-2-methylmalate dehydratase small subunit